MLCHCRETQETLLSWLTATLTASCRTLTTYVAGGVLRSVVWTLQEPHTPLGPSCLRAQRKAFSDESMGGVVAVFPCGSSCWWCRLCRLRRPCAGTDFHVFAFVLGLPLFSFPSASSCNCNDSLFLLTNLLITQFCFY